METYFGHTKKTWLPISLGFNCHVKVFIDEICQIDRRSYPRLPFDWIGTPMSSVYELTMSNFDGLNDPNKLVVRRRFEDKDTNYLTHIDYNCVFVHDYKNINDISPDTYAKIDADYKRRIDRWNFILNNNTQMIFIRLEQEPNSKRIVYPGNARENDEYKYLQLFAEHMKTRKLQFYIIYLSTTKEKGFDRDHNIITINFNKQRPDIIISGDHISAIIRAHKDYITSFFN